MRGSDALTILVDDRPHSHASEFIEIKSFTNMNILFKATGRHPDHVRCSHYNIIAADVIKINATRIIFRTISVLQ